MKQIVKFFNKNNTDIYKPIAMIQIIQGKHLKLKESMIKKRNKEFTNFSKISLRNGKEQKGEWMNKMNVFLRNAWI